MIMMIMKTKIMIVMWIYLSTNMKKPDESEIIVKPVNQSENDYKSNSFL